MNKVAMIGGPPTQASEGWLKPMFPITGKAHYFEEFGAFEDEVHEPARKYWDSMCGLSAISTERMPMFEAGNWVRCKHCEQLLARRGAA